MPRAVVNIIPEHFDLKTCPGGWIELRRMSYDAWLHRTDISLQMQIEMEKNSQRRGGGKGTMSLQNQAVTMYEFSQCVVGHNLEDENGNLLDLTRASTLKRLDPKIGNEIGELIAYMHESLTEEEEGNSEVSSGQ